MSNALSMTNDQVGVIVSAYFIAYALFTPIAGFLADKLGVKRVVASFIAIMGIASFLMSLSNNFLQCLAFFFIVGLGSAAAWAPMATLTRRLVPSSRRGLALGIIDSGSSIGYLIASLIMPVLVSSYSWRLHWIVWGIASLLIAALTLIAIPHLKTPKLQSLKYPKRLSFWFTAFSYMMFGMALWVPLTFLVTYGLSEVGLSYWLASMLGVTIAISSIPGKLLLPHVSDIIGRYKIISLSLLLIALSQALYVLIPSKTLIFVYTCLLGLGYGGCAPLYSALATDFSDRAGTILGLWTTFYSIGSMISPKISGMLADLTGSFKIPFIYGAVSALISILLIILASAAREKS